MSGIVVGVESSKAGARALDRALLEGRRTGQRVRLVRAWLPPIWVSAAMGPFYNYGALEAGQASAAQAEEDLLEMAANAKARGPATVETSVQVEEGRADEVLLEASRDADLVVLGGHRHNTASGTMLGHTTSALLHKAGCPVMVVPAEGPPAAPFRRIVAGVDGTDASLRALRWAQSVATSEGRPLVAATAWRVHKPPRDVDSYLAAEQSWLESSVIDVLGAGNAVCVVLAGDPETELIHAVHENDLLVVGTQGARGLAALGSVARQCVLHAPCVVAVVLPSGHAAEHGVANLAQTAPVD